jgi:hypothetical protein
VSPLSREELREQLDAAKKTLAAHWAVYEQLVVAPGATEKQRADVRAVYYAGAAVMFDLAVFQPVRLAMDVDASMEHLAALQDEIHEHAEAARERARRS